MCVCVCVCVCVCERQPQKQNDIREISMDEWRKKGSCYRHSAQHPFCSKFDLKDNSISFYCSRKMTANRKSFLKYKIQRQNKNVSLFVIMKWIRKYNIVWKLLLLKHRLWGSANVTKAPIVPIKSFLQGFRGPHIAFINTIRVRGIFLTFRESKKVKTCLTNEPQT